MDSQNIATPRDLCQKEPSGSADVVAPDFNPGSNEKITLRAVGSAHIHPRIDGPSLRLSLSGLVFVSPDSNPGLQDVSSLRLCCSVCLIQIRQRRYILGRTNAQAINGDEPGFLPRR